MLTIRLSRQGRKNQPTYRIVLQEKDWSPSSKVLEILGNVNTRTNPTTVSLKKERISYWISQGAQTSATVHNILVNNDVIKAAKKRVVFGKKKKIEAKTPVAQ